MGKLPDRVSRTQLGVAEVGLSGRNSTINTPNPVDARALMKISKKKKTTCSKFLNSDLLNEDLGR